MGLDMYFYSSDTKATVEELNSYDREDEDREAEGWKTVTDADGQQVAQVLAIDITNGVPEIDESDSSSLHFNMEEIQYFRKHSDLHGWLESKYLEEHPEAEDLNVTYFEITPPLNAQMMVYAKRKKHKKCSGFFWGESDDDQWEETRKLCLRIQDEFDNGRRVFYYAWY